MSIRRQGHSDAKLESIVHDIVCWIQLCTVTSSLPAFMFSAIRSRLAIDSRASKWAFARLKPHQLQTIVAEMTVDGRLEMSPHSWMSLGMRLILMQLVHHHSSFPHFPFPRFPFLLLYQPSRKKRWRTDDPCDDASTGEPCQICSLSWKQWN